MATTDPFASHPASTPATYQSPAVDHNSAAGEDDGYEPFAPPGRRFLWFTALPSWLISLVVHMVGLFALALITMPAARQTTTQLVVPVSHPIPEEMEEFQLDEMVPVEQLELSKSTLGPTDEMVTQTLDVETPDLHFADDLDAAPIQMDLTQFAEQAAPRNALTQVLGSSMGTGVQGRGSAMRADLVKRYGGTKGSEAAVAAALKWIAYHQLPDGGWSFDHTIGPGPRQSPNPGELREARNAATAMALLPFLGAGQTHMEGEYKEVVARGLYFLIGRQRPNGSFSEEGGQLYSHGLAAIVLCEAFAMTNDVKLAPAAQGALNFIVFAQDPVGGGWRYAPKQAGDTSVVGWQLMALKSGHMGYLQVPPIVIVGAGRFLDSVQTDGGAKYGYTSPGAGDATTAVGLLCRMYLGWKQDNPALQRGVEFLSSKGPSTGDMYYNYYATQVLRHYGGDKWDQWNTRMRDFLVQTQSTEGPSQGSWFIPGDHGADRGGRLYSTSMATMILEVYYRHLPIYGEQAAEEEFPL